MQYIATFFSHFGAVRFQHLCTERGWQAQVRPVPAQPEQQLPVPAYFLKQMHWRM